MGATTRLCTRTIPYEVPTVSVMATQACYVLLCISVTCLYFYTGLGLPASAACAVGALATARALRFVFLQVTAFEIWHAGKLLFSGIESWDQPYMHDIEDILEELEKRGVGVNKLAKALLRGAAG
mmetsp:Transcript_16585/g.22321  ORF Transcript_16585/g.22321 Transcript_16585/m.22321 type:complete len:125 (+) Transcript_16585:41-415(+)